MRRPLRPSLLSAVLASLLVLWLRPLPASYAGCPDAELFSGKLITDICWACLFPIRIAGLSIALLPEAGWAIRAVVLAAWLGMVHLLGGA